MKIFKHIAPLKSHLKEQRLSGKSIGLVPTMGALHEGHIALLRASQQENDITVSTIFVNPTQFNNAGDLSRYPRTPDKDTRLLEEVRCDILFIPETGEVYPAEATIKIDFGTLDKVMEGHFRPGHFSGVALIVSKLFHIIEPHRAYFGQKDWQQFAIIQQLVDELNFPVELRSIPTLREGDGLALSSRNQRLDPESRRTATIFYRALRHARDLLLQDMDIPAVKEAVAQMIAEQPAAQLEYFEIADKKNLKALKSVEAANDVILCIAGYVGGVRLIDNLLMEGAPALSGARL